MSSPGRDIVWNWSPISSEAASRRASLSHSLTCVVIKVDPASHGVEHGLWLFEDLLLHERTVVSCTSEGNARKQEGTQLQINT